MKKGERRNTDFRRKRWAESLKYSMLRVYRRTPTVHQGKTLFVFGGGTSEENFTVRDGIGEFHS